MFQDHLIGSRRSSSGKNIVLEHEYLRFDSIVCDKSFIFMESLSQLCNIKWRAGVIVPGLCWNKNANVKVIEETWSTKVRCLLRCAHLKVPWKSGMRAVRWKFCLSLLMSLSLFSHLQLKCWDPGALRADSLPFEYEFKYYLPRRTF